MILIIPTFTQLHSVQYSAARLLTKTSYSSHITPGLMSLHGLLIKFRIQFQFLLIYKALSGLASEYISELLMPYILLDPLRSCEVRADDSSQCKTENTRRLCIPLPVNVAKMRLFLVICKIKLRHKGLKDVTDVKGVI